MSQVALSARPATGLLSRRWDVRADPWLIGPLAVAAFAFAIRLSGADQQSAYMDEGTNVLTGRMLIEQHAVYAEVLNWAYGSYVWPLIAGVADEMGGLRMVRGVTAVCGALMVLATTLTALRLAPTSLSSARRWGIALLAGGVMALAPTAVAVGRFGTYDALAGAAFMLGATLLLPTSGRDVPRLHLLGAAALLFVAFLSKYLVAVYFPFVCLYVVLRHGRQIRAAVHDAVWFVLPLGLLCTAYLLVFLGPLLSLLTSSLRYGDLKSADPLREYVWNRPELWVLVAIAAIAWRFAEWRGRLVAVGGAAIIVGFQALARPDFDFWKHSIYLIYFLAPLAALTWTRVPLRTGTAAVVSVGAWAAAALVAWSPVLHDADQLTAFYPNLNSSITAVQQAIAGSAVVLTDDTALRYYEYPTMGTNTLIGPFSYAYQSQDGLEAYRRAIADRFFDAIVLDGGVTPQGAAIRSELSQTIQAGYQQVYSSDDGGFSIQVFKPVRPSGSTTPQDGQASWPVAYTFDGGDAGTAGWGVHPDSGDWQAGQQISTVDQPTWNGHPSLQFAPSADASIVSLRIPQQVTRMRARVFVTPTDPNTSTPLRVGFIAFDTNWQWHDDGFRWVVPPGSWTTITWDLPAPGDYSEVGLQFPGGVSQAYVGSFEIQP